MQALTASELIAVWERARGEPTTARALILLEAASPDISEQELARLSVGQRDARLLALRELIFGSQLNGLTSCPGCGQRLEIGIESTDLRLGAASSDHELLSVESSGYLARFRLPNSEDLSALAQSLDAHVDQATAVGELLSRCIVELQRNGRRVKLRSSRALPPALIDAIAVEMEKVDPQANVQITLNCSDCGHRWLSAFDIVSFLWSEIDNLATRLVREVCALAFAFGWRERDILEMSSQRRQLYLEMIADAP
jgi:hypothetical protein